MEELVCPLRVCVSVFPWLWEALPPLITLPHHHSPILSAAAAAQHVGCFIKASLSRTLAATDYRSKSGLSELCAFSELTLISATVGHPLACIFSSKDVGRGGRVHRHTTLGSGGVCFPQSCF